MKTRLPGRDAQDKMAPPQRQADPGTTDRPRQSAVLALLCAARHAGLPEADAWHIVFTQRQATLRHHGGQISFPGGGYEDRDTSLLHTALRETQEELGMPTEDIEVLGSLTPLFIAPSQNQVQPYVGWLPKLPPLSPNPAEVAAVLTLPLSALLSPDARDVYRWCRNGQEMPAPCYHIEEIVIWGATAMMLSELLAVVQGVLDEGTLAVANPTGPKVPRHATIRPVTS